MPDQTQPDHRAAREYARRMRHATYHGSDFVNLLIAYADLDQQLAAARAELERDFADLARRLDMGCAPGHATAPATLRQGIENIFAYDKLMYEAGLLAGRRFGDLQQEVQALRARLFSGCVIDARRTSQHAGPIPNEVTGNADQKTKPDHTAAASYAEAWVGGGHTKKKQWLVTLAVAYLDLQRQIDEALKAADRSQGAGPVLVPDRSATEPF